ncbi:MAG: AraC family transcriptional regulator [Bdellovibrionota bacterium]
MSDIEKKLNALSQINDSHLQKCIQYIIGHFEEEISLSHLANAVGISEWAVCRRFQVHLGVSPMKWVWCFRVHLASECIILTPSWSLTDISVLCGFNSLAHFSRLFKNQFDISPTDFRAKNQVKFPTSSQLQADKYREFLFDSQLLYEQGVLDKAALAAISS